MPLIMPTAILVFLLGSALIGCGSQGSTEATRTGPSFAEPMRARIVEWENNPQIKWGPADDEMVATIMKDEVHDLSIGAFLSGAIKTNVLSPEVALKRMDEWQKRWPDRTETWQVTRDMVNRLKAERGG
jgi:hypothetical protein